MAMGEFGLMRVAGLPVRLWLAGSSPALFDLLRELDRLDVLLAGLRAELADRIGTELVPHRDLTVPRRRQALNLRRKLHNGVVVAADCARVAESVRELGVGGGLAERLDEAAGTAGREAALAAEARAAYAAERERLLDLPWRLLTEDPVGRRALADGVMAPAEDIRRRLANGEAWRTKRMRRRSAYLWHMIARGAVKTTPRTWLSHVAMVDVDGAAAGPLALPTLADRCAVNVMQSMHVPRRELALSGKLSPDTRVAVASLRTLAGEHARFWAIDPANADELRSVTVRRTPLLVAIADALDGGVLTVAEVQAALLGPDAGEANRNVLAEFMGHLAMMGIIEPSTPPRKDRRGWQPVTQAVTQAVAQPVGPSPAAGAADAVPAGEERYVDVYRTATGPLSGAGALAVEESIRQMMRIYGAMRMRPPGQPEPGHGGPRFMSRLTEEPRPVLEVLAERLTEVVAARKAEAAGKAAEKADDATAAPAPKRAEHPSTGWRPPVEGTPYHALVRWIDAEAASGPGGAPVRITSDVLDAVGAPEHDLAWPLDCTVRPFGSGHEAVLDMTMPGGILDARFNEALEGLHGTLDHVEAYRAFLAELDERTGVTSVELMIPPLRDVAANAVRRPAYATAWTGDADLSGYCEPDPRRPMRFLPLTELTVRRHGDKVVVEHLGQRVRILYHSMRVAPWPWSLLSSMLTYDNEQQDSNVPRLRCPLVALPDRDFLPRLLIGDAVVLSPAQWRVKSGRFWDPAADGELDKARRLVRLRAELGLPRFVAVYSRGHYGKPYPCDLDSLAAVETVERALGPAGAAADPDLDVYVEEMLPAPDEMPTRDLAHLADDRVAAEVMLRLPMHATPGDLAARAAGSRSAELVAVP